MKIKLHGIDDPVLLDMNQTTEVYLVDDDGAETHLGKLNFRTDRSGMWLDCWPNDLSKIAMVRFAEQEEPPC